MLSFKQQQQKKDHERFIIDESIWDCVEDFKNSNAFVDKKNKFFFFFQLIIIIIEVNLELEVSNL